MHLSLWWEVWPLVLKENQSHFFAPKSTSYVSIKRLCTEDVFSCTCHTFEIYAFVGRLASSLFLPWLSSRSIGITSKYEPSASSSWNVKHGSGFPFYRRVLIMMPSPPLLSRLGTCAGNIHVVLEYHLYNGHFQFCIHRYY